MAVYLIGAIILMVLLLGFVVWRDVTGRRPKAIRAELPEVLDLLTVTIEAGMSLDGAMTEVAERSTSFLGAEFRQVLLDIKNGIDRGEALEAMARRCGNADIDTMVEAIRAAELAGTPLADVLRFQANELRRMRRERAQRKASTARLKMMLPMILFIFPTIWVVILGPAVPLVMHSLGQK